MTRTKGTGTSRPRRWTYLVALLAAGVLAALTGAVVRSGNTAAAEETRFCRSLLPADSGEGEQTTLKGCADRLETAMTGRPAGRKPPAVPERHTTRQYRTLEKTVTSYADRTRQAPRAMPTEIRRCLANALAHHPREVHTALAGKKPSGHARLDRPSTRDVLRAVFEDDHAFRMVQKSQMRVVAAGIGRLGAYDFTHADDGRPVGFVEEAALVVSRLYQVRDEVIDGREARGSAEDARQAIEHYEENGFPRLEALIRDRAKETGLSEAQLRGDLVQGLLDAAEDAYVHA